MKRLMYLPGWLTGMAAMTAALAAQDRLKTMPGYDQYQRVAPQIGTPS